MSIILSVLLLLGDPAAAQESGGPQVVFNEAEIAALWGPHVSTDDPMDVLRFILDSAGPEITVYPSEGYYYFSFQNGPRVVAGNLRFDLLDAARGFLNFAYYSAAPVGDDPVNHFSLLGADDGVSLLTVDPFEYRMEFQGKVTRVRIYDAREELAGPKPLASDELYVGPVFDESGVRLHLVFDQTERAFFFVLNRSAPEAETFSAVPGFPLVHVGNRTGYAFYEDAQHDRWIMVGVARQNVVANNHFDGPFDQLPDRFIDPNQMRQLIELAYPDLSGQVGPRGVFLDSPHMRAMVAPYRRYASTEELSELSDCNLGAEDNHALTRCLQAFVKR